MLKYKIIAIKDNIYTFIIYPEGKKELGFKFVYDANTMLPVTPEEEWKEYEFFVDHICYYMIRVQNGEEPLRTKSMIAIY